MSKSLFVLLVLSTVAVMFSCQIGMTPEFSGDLENTDSTLNLSDQVRSTKYICQRVGVDYYTYSTIDYNVGNYVYIPPTYNYNKNGYTGTLNFWYYNVTSVTYVYAGVFVYKADLFYQGYVSNGCPCD